MKMNGNEIRPGNVIEHKGGLWVAVKTQAVKPGKGGAFNQVELKNLIDRSKLNERFRSSETVERVRLEQKDYQFLYADGDMLTFMDLETYDQIQLAADFLEERAAFLQDGMKVVVESHEGKHISVSLPAQVTLEVVTPASRAFKAAKWHLIARDAGVSDFWLDLYMAKMSKQDRTRAEEDARAWVRQLKER